VLAGDPPALAVGVLIASAVALILGGRTHRELRARTALQRVPPAAWQSASRRHPGDRSPDAADRARPPTSDEVASSMVLLAVALQSGCGVVEAIEQVADVAPPASGIQLSVVAAAWRWGVPEDEAWSEVDRRWSRTAMALRLAREAGVPASSLLLSGATDLRDARLAAIDVAAARLGVRLVVPLGVAFLPAFVLTTIVPVVLALARQVLG
jgi:pilus assembly protein TadC